MEHQCLAKHRQLWRTELILPMMANKQVLHQRLVVRRKALDAIHSFRHLLEPQNDMTQQLTVVGVMNRTFIAKLVQLTDIVQSRACKQKIEIQFKIVLSSQSAQIAQADNMLEQAAHKSMVHHFCRRGALQPRKYRGVLNYSGDQTA